MLRGEGEPSRSRTMLLVLKMSVPAILSEISTTVMNYIDAAMVGSLGAQASGAIGLVSSSSWLFPGFCECAAMGYSIQVAQFVGAGRLREARDVMCQGIVVCLTFSCLLAGLGAAISGPLPFWLGGDPSLAADASAYFLVLMLSTPAFMAQRLGALMLQSSGDMVAPSVLNVLSCCLDVLFNALLITSGTTVGLGGLSLALPGAGLGVMGAALGTGIATAVVALVMLWLLLARSPVLGLGLGASWSVQALRLREALGIGAPLFLERLVVNGAYIAQTVIIAPLGTVSVAANSLAVTAESLCYMPGFGISQAATTLVGQAFGSHRRDLSRRFANYSTLLGAVTMGLGGLCLWLFAPAMMEMLTIDPQVRELGSAVLRIESLAEPLYGVSLVASGALRGAGDTLAPSLINLGCIWAVRVALAPLLVPALGLRGMWVAMSLDLNVRGVLFLVRLLRGRWLDRASVVDR